MAIKLISVGKLKEKYLLEGVNEYTKRLSRFTKLTQIEISDERAPESLSNLQMMQIKQKEGERILNKVKENEYIFALAINGKQYSSIKLAQKINLLGVNGKSNLTFIIGGSLGLSEEVLKHSHEQISFSSFTFPHQLMRLILVEQIYRSFMINSGSTYHK